MEIAKKIIISLLIIVISSCGGSSGGETPPPAPVIKTPGKATLVAPASGTTCEEGANSTATQSAVTFRWNSSTDTETYDLRITNLNTQELTTQSGITSTTQTVVLTRGVPYSWSITSKNKGTTTTVSDTWRFYLAGVGIVNYAPFPASVVSPLSGAIVTPTNGRVTLSWETSDVEGSPLTYTLFFDTVDGKQPPIDANKNLTTKTREVTVSANTIYYWRVTASDGFNSSTSVVYTFKTP